MPLQTIEPQRLYRQIGDQLRALIEAGEFAVGERLPAERSLALQLGVSRPSLREALIALEVEGYIEVRMGSGIYVCQPVTDAARALELSREEAPLELIRARRMIEGEVAAAAARIGRKPQFDAIEEALRRMQTDTEAGLNPLAADREFHMKVAEATGNSVLVGLVGRLFDARLGPLFATLDGHFETSEVWAAAIAEHREVLKALRARDAARARAAMRRHMDVSFERLTSSLTRARKADKKARVTPRATRAPKQSKPSAARRASAAAAKTPTRPARTAGRRAAR